MSLRSRRALVSWVVVLFVANIANGPLIRAQTVNQTEHGAIVHTSNGTVQVEACSDTVLHIIESSGTKPSEVAVPTIIQPCNGSSHAVSSDDSYAYLRTGKLTVEIDKNTGRVSFHTIDGRTVLAEQSESRPISSAESAAPSGGVSQQFQLTPGEALYGLGQHQEGFFDLRDIPIQLLQANSNIAIPFLISTNGYGLLWNNPSLLISIQ